MNGVFLSTDGKIDKKHEKGDLFTQFLSTFSLKMLYYSAVVEIVTDSSKSSPITFDTLIGPKTSKPINIISMLRCGRPYCLRFVLA